MSEWGRKKYQRWPSRSPVASVKGGVKPGQCGGVKVGQSIVGGCCGIAG
jgi:hypothetical protein